MAARSTPASSSRSNACWSIRISCCACTTAIAAISRLERYRARVAPVVLLVEQHSRRARCSTPAERGELSKPAMLEQQVRRMLADPRATTALVDNFASQWLNLRRVDEVVVHPDFYPDFDDNLLAGIQAGDRALRREHAARRSQRVGSAARRLHVRQRAARAPLQDSRHLRHAASGASRCRTPISAAACSPTARSSRRRRIPIAPRRCCAASGCSTTSSALRAAAAARCQHHAAEVRPGTLPPTIRERLAQHRTNPVCNSCHSVIDPPGFALENFDVIGGWRTIDESGKPVDAVGTTVSGAPIDGLKGLRALLLKRPDQLPDARSRKSCWRMRSAGGSITTISRRCAKSSTTRPRKTIAGRRSSSES